MADVMPNYNLERAQIELQIAEMELSKRRSYVRKLQINDELARIEENERATNKKIDELREQLAGIKLPSDVEVNRG